MQPQLLTSDREDWCTPDHIIDRVRLVDTIGLDPCSNPSSLVGATTELSLSKGDDGLVVPWGGQGLVYVNPPYGRKVSKWVQKISFEAQSTDIIALLAARTDTKWFHELILPYASSIVFVKGRIKFIDGVTGMVGHPAPFPSMIVHYSVDSEKEKKFYDAFHDLGYHMDTVT